MKNYKLYFLLILFIVCSTDTIFFGTNINRNFELLCISIIFFLLLLLMYFHFRKHPVLLKYDILIFLVAFSILISMLQAGRLFNGYSYIIQIICFLFGWAFSYYISVEDFQKVYRDVMRLIAIVSLLCYIFAPIIVKINFIPTLVNTSGLRFKYLIFSNVPYSSSSQRRLWGPFWEPGVFQAYLNIAIYFTLFYGGKYKVFDYIIFSLCALLTLSGAAFFPLAIFTIAYLISSHEKENMRKRIIILSSIFLFVYFYFDPKFNEMIFKVTGGFDSYSFTFRYYSIVVNIQEFIKYPIFGSTPQNLDHSRQIFIRDLTGSDYLSNTNTFFAIL